MVRCPWTELVLAEGELVMGKCRKWAEKIAKGLTLVWNTAWKVNQFFHLPSVNDRYSGVEVHRVWRRSIIVWTSDRRELERQTAQGDSFSNLACRGEMLKFLRALVDITCTLECILSI